MSKNFVAYYRVSTDGQGRSRLGLEAQQAAVEAFTKGRGEVEREFEEIESGKRDSRPQLQASIEHAKATGATLVIAKLDRLSRDAAFILNLRKAGVDFVACDLPEFNSLTLAVFAGMAQHERELISQRTKAALAARKARGDKLGTPRNLTEKARAKSCRVRRDAALSNPANLKAVAIAKDLQTQGLGLHKIARKLNAYGLKGAKGGKYYAVTVQKLFKLYL